MTILNETIQYRLVRAEEAYHDAQILAQSGSWNSCVNRLYYSCFYAVSATAYWGIKSCNNSTWETSF